MDRLAYISIKLDADGHQRGTPVIISKYHEIQFSISENKGHVNSALEYITTCRKLESCQPASELFTTVKYQTLGRATFMRLCVVVPSTYV